jgi:tetratricopeptide (TPR) repeat protein
LLIDVALTHFWLDDDIVARNAAMRAWSILDEQTPASNPERIEMLDTISEILVGTGEYETAEKLLDESLAAGRQLLGENHPGMAALLGLKATLRHAQGSLQEAELLARQALAVSMRTKGTNTIYGAHLQTTVSAILLDMGKAQDSETEARSAALTLKKVADDDHPYAVSCMHVLAEALLLQKEYGEAEVLLREELAALEKQGSSDWRLARAASTLGEVMLSTGNLAEAEKYLAAAEAKLTRTKGWPVERENRNLNRRFQQLAKMRANQRVTKL